MVNKSDELKSQRIAKFLSHAGVCSRRDAEKLILAGRVKVDGKMLDTPATLVTADSVVQVDDQTIDGPDEIRAWLFHKPAGVVTTARDTHGRTTVFDVLPNDLPRVISVGRLDLNTEGLLILTNSGTLARYMELPANQFERHYKVRVYGQPDTKRLDEVRRGVKIDGIQFAPADVRISTDKGRNTWLDIIIREGKYREVRKLMQHVGVRVNRLIRVQYGPFKLGELEEGAVQEVGDIALKKALPDLFKAKA